VRSLGVSVSNNQFYGQTDTVAAVYAGAQVWSSSVQDNAMDGITQMIFRAPGARVSSTELVRAVWDANSAVLGPAVIVNSDGVVLATVGQPAQPSAQGVTLYTGADGHLYALLGANAATPAPVKIA
jgi:hypothetical protein